MINNIKNKLQNFIFKCKQFISLLRYTCKVKKNPDDNLQISVDINYR